MQQQQTDSRCKCPACLVTEGAGSLPSLPYRQGPGRGLVAFHLILHASLPLLGAFLIGRSWLALVPLLGSCVAYLANSFILCPTCAYHHAGIRFCGCYPKSVFSYRRYLGKRWGRSENGIGRSLVVGMTIGPSIAILAARGDAPSVGYLLSSTAFVLFLTSVVSCPTCRQREVCYLGMLTMAGIGRKNI